MGKYGIGYSDWIELVYARTPIPLCKNAATHFEHNDHQTIK